MSHVRGDVHVPRIGHRPMALGVHILGCLLAAIVLTTGTHAASPAPTDRPGQAIVIGGVVAAGPFGSAEGVSVAAGQPLPDLASLDTLDAFGRGAQLRVTPDVGSFDQWRVTAIQEPLSEAGTVDELGSGDGRGSATFRMPSTGLFLVRLDGTVVDPTTTDPGTPGTWVWRIAVPDRDIPGGGDPYPPMPGVQLASGDRSIELDQGSGCFVGTCGDIGATSPPQTLPTIRTLARAPLTVRLSDGSGISGWLADATPVDATDDQTLVLGSASASSPVGTITFAAPPKGRWVILVHVRFDRDRGATDGYGRLILE